MQHRKVLLTSFAVIAAALVVAASIGAILSQSRNVTPVDVMEQADAAFAKGNYSQASALYMKAYRGFTFAKDQSSALNALHQKFISDRIIWDYPNTREDAESQLRAMFPSMTAETASYLVGQPEIETLTHDGAVWYFSDVAMNIAFRNQTLIQELMSSIGGTLIYDQLLPLIKASRNETATYFNLTDYIATGTLSVPYDALPHEGTMRMWIPVPINTSSQVDISVTVEPNQYVVSQTTADADLGLVYLEIPMEEISGDLSITMTAHFSEYQKHFDIDPANLGAYDVSSELYQTYTASNFAITVTPEITALAHQIVGDETNPYLQAKMIYEHVIGNISYSYTPHVHLDALGLPESEYVRTNKFGDCGAQSIYFTALLRSLGIPARSCGGFQSFPPGNGTHFWAEYYLPNYGWVPVDVTAAETADWSYDATPEDAQEFKDFFFGNLDPYRMVLQNDEGEPLVPSSGDSVQLKIVTQWPTFDYPASDIDLSIYLAMTWNWQIEPA
jgi:transglutaminase-like putative cysteine protease